MAAGTLRHSRETISRQALGRIAKLGDLYNAQTDKFCGVSIFRHRLPPDFPAISKIDNAQTNIAYTTGSSFRDKSLNLNITADLQLSFLAGLFEPGGSAKYLRNTKESFKSVEGTLLYNVKTVSEHLELSDKEVEGYIISEEAMSGYRADGATHVVVQIEWGGNCIMTVTDQKSDSNDKHDVEVNINAHLKKVKSLSSLSGNAEIDVTQEENADCQRLSFAFFSDGLLDSLEEFPQTFAGASALMRKVPELIRKYNDGKGKPVTYIMLPVSFLPAQKPLHHRESLSTCEPVSSVDESRAIRTVHLFDNIAELRQKVHDQIDELNSHSYCVTSSELEEARRIENDLEVHVCRVKDELAQLLKDIRSATEDVTRLDSFCDKHYRTAKDTFRELDGIYDAVLERIEFRKRCETYGARYLAPPVEQGIASGCDNFHNVYVLFHGRADGETTRRNESAFIELAKENQNDSKTVCYFTWSKQGDDVRIKHFRRGRLVQDDVARQLETKNVARCVPATRRAFCLMPFKVRCPGSFDGDCSREERTWTCMDCNETLHLCPDDRTLHCSCGHNMANRFRFRCSSHCSDFKQFRDDDTLQTALERHISMASKGDHSVILIIKYINISIFVGEKPYRLHADIVNV